MIELLVCAKEMGSWGKGDVLTAKAGAHRYVEPGSSAEINAALNAVQRTESERKRIIAEGYDTAWGATELREFAVIVLAGDLADITQLLALDANGTRTHQVVLEKLVGDETLKNIVDPKVLVKPDRAKPVSVAELKAAIRKKS